MSSSQLKGGESMDAAVYKNWYPEVEAIWKTTKELFEIESVLREATKQGRQNLVKLLKTRSGIHEYIDYVIDKYSTKV